jgi:hypothetical protein
MGLGNPWGLGQQNTKKVALLPSQRQDTKLRKQQSMQVLTDFPLHLDIDLILRGQGVDPARARQRFTPLRQAAEEALQLGRPLIQPAALVHTLPVEAFHHERLSLANGGTISGPAIARFLAPAQEVAVVICTIGDQMELLISEAMKSEPILGLALDGLANGAVENLGTAVCRYYERQAALRGWQCSLPVSPGMEGWPLADAQRQLFALVDSSLVDVRLTDSSVMLPLKSASMILGLGAEIIVQGGPCDFCNLRETCRYRDTYAGDKDGTV